MNKQPINRGASGETSKTKTEKQPKNLGASGETSESKFDCTNDFYKWIPESKMFDSVNFGFLKLGSLCNASENSAFTSAICNIEHIKNKTREHYSLNIQHLFSKGCGLIKDIQKEEKELDETSSAALNRLKMFFEKKGKSKIVVDSFALINYLNFCLDVIKICSMNINATVLKKILLKKFSRGEGVLLGTMVIENNIRIINMILLPGIKNLKAHKTFQSNYYILLQIVCAYTSCIHSELKLKCIVSVNKGFKIVFEINVHV